MTQTAKELPNAQRLLVRSIWAVALYLGFRLIGVVMVGALLWLPYMEIRYSTLTPAGILAAFLAIAVLWALRPRLKKPRRMAHALPDGPLTHLVNRIAQEVGVEPPDAVFVLTEPNAFTGIDRPSWFRQERVVGIGLPFLFGLSESELRAVIAHEFGHHHGGDLKLGPWLHGTRFAIGDALADLSGSSFFLDLPFAWYANFFLRVTRPVARLQELHADAVGAKVSGPTAMASALAKTETLADDWDEYWFGDVMPLIQSGFQPDLYGGFKMFREYKRTAGDRRESKVPPQKRAPHPHDTHPTLAVRLENLSIPSDFRLRDETPWFVTATDSTAGKSLEKTAIDQSLIGPPLSPIAWADVPRVWSELIVKRFARDKTYFSRFSLDRLIDLAAEPARWFFELPRQGVRIISASAELKQARAVLHDWLCTQSMANGFLLHLSPGAPIEMVRGETRVNIEHVLTALMAGNDTAQWREAIAQWVRPMQADR